MNSCHFIGRTTRDAELRYTTTGKAVLNFTLAVDGGKVDGEKQTTFIDHVMFAERAEKVASWVTKGRLIATEGRLNIRAYEGKDGSKKKTTQIIVSNIHFLDKAKDATGGIGIEVADDDPFSK